VTDDEHPEDEAGAAPAGEARAAAAPADRAGAAAPAPPRHRPPAAETPPPIPRPPHASALPQPLHTLGAAPGERGWGWSQSLWGLLLGMSPTFALYLAARVSSGKTDAGDAEVTVATGLIFLVSGALGYAWNYFAAWLFSGRRVRHKWRAWGFRKPTAAFFWVIPAALVAAYVVSYVNDVVFHPPKQEIVHAFPPTIGGLILFAIVAVIMAPLAEELYFRGFIFKGFANSWGWGWGALASATVFSLAHLQITLFFPLFALGLGLAWVYRHTGSLWTSIALHAVFNGVSVLAWALTT